MYCTQREFLDGGLKCVTGLFLSVRWIEAGLENVRAFAYSHNMS